MDFLPIFTKMVGLFAIIIIGYIGNKVDVVGAEAKRQLSKLVLNVTLPATVLSAVMNSSSLPDPSEIGGVLVVSFLSYVVFFVIAKVSVFLMRLEGKQKAVAEFAIIFSNVGFIGYPVTEAIFGPESLFYTTIFNMPFNLVCYSFGVQLIEVANAKESGDGKVRKLTAKEWAKMILSPALIASVLALLIAFTGVKFPVIVGYTAQTLGNITTPAALLIIGSALAEMPILKMFNNVKAYMVTIVSVVITPLVTYLIFNPFIGDNYIFIGEAVVIAAMPVATAGTMVCVEYGGDEQFMAQVTFLSTLATVVTIPLIAMIL